jgi:16S rRNA pseudouridine516 synthase
MGLNRRGTLPMLIEKDLMGIGDSEKLRLDKFLADMGRGSRSEVKRLIKFGRVTVNQTVIRDPGRQVNCRADRIMLEGTEVLYRRYIYLMLNKPAGVISATEDFRERTVLELIDPRYRNRGIFPVGRLDKDTEGLLLLTNHGELGHRLLSPKRHVLKWYFAKIAGVVCLADREAFQQGVVLEDGYRCLPAELKILQADAQSEVMVGIFEGKFHQVKRMFETRDKGVVYLKRLSMGGLHLDERLNPGEYRELTEEEVKTLEGRED